MQTQTPSTKPMTIRGQDDRAHLVSDMKGQSPGAPRPRIRPIVPNIFRTPD